MRISDWSSDVCSSDLLEPLSPADLERLTAFAQETGLAVLLQPGGPNTVQPLWPQQLELSFAIPEANVSLQFQPLDFIQVNAGLNQRMIASAADLLQPAAADRRSEEHTSELQSLMRTSYAVFCLKNTN